MTLHFQIDRFLNGFLQILFRESELNNIPLENSFIHVSNTVFFIFYGPLHDARNYVSKRVVKSPKPRVFLQKPQFVPSFMRILCFLRKKGYSVK